MARMSEPNTANSQFFINVVDNAFLNRSEDKPGYAVFGKVIEGMDVVDKIRVVPVAPQGVHQHFPVTPILITKALIEPTPK